jgi:outer membrane protein assembly factor BamD (BamD/ComL family)
MRAKQFILSIWVAGAMGTCFIACKSKDEKTNFKNSVDSIEAVLYKSAAAAPVDAVRGEAAMRAYIAYANKFPQDTLSANYIFKAAEVASAIKMSQPAVEYFDRFITEYPEHPKAATALFLKAFVLENDLNKYGEATAAYNLVIQKYPNTSFARDAAACIQNMGKTTEELIKEFEKKNQNQ